MSSATTSSIPKCDVNVHDTNRCDTECAIVRNGGGRTTDAIRSILDLDALGAMGTIVVIHHTGMYSFNYIYQERQSS